MRQVLLIMLIYCLFSRLAEGQEDATLFFMHSTPQANFVNPAVRNDCKWMLGLPVVSSVHAEYGNPEFTIMQAFKKQPDNTYLFDGSQIINNLGNNNYLSAEIHANLFFLSFWKNDNFYTVSVNDKADLFVTYPRDALALAWNGNTQFIGQTANLSHTGIFLNYRREYAFGIARQPSAGWVWGIRGKLLFGKLNTSIGESTMQLYTQPVTFDLFFNANWQVNTSLPVSVSTDQNHNLQSVTYNGTPGGILLNRSNIGLATDIGFIRKFDNDITLSGSLLDLGIIRWAHPGNSFAQNGTYIYTGPTDTTRYLNSLLNAVKTDFGICSVRNSYLSFLIPTYYFGAEYNVTHSLTLGLVSSGKINRYRVTSGLTLSANKTFSERISVSVSYSYLFKSFNNLGAGIKIGKSPVQFYAVSDNIPGLIKPLETKNINLRFGLQFNFGCFRKEKFKDCGCNWLKKASKDEERKQQLLHKDKDI